MVSVKALGIKCFFFFFDKLRYMLLLMWQQYFTHDRSFFFLEEGKRNFIKVTKANQIGKKIPNHKVVLLPIH